MASVLEDLLNSDLTSGELKIQVRTVWENTLSQTDSSERYALGERTKSTGTAKNLNDFYSLVSKAVNNYEKRASVPVEKKVVFTEEEPDTQSKTETITFSLISRSPGAFGQGPPLEGTHRNLRPILREEKDDPDNPGYKSSILGYWHDNIVRFTCWARTNKVANDRAIWFEALMDEYQWWFKLQGVDRVIFHGRGADIVTEVNGNKWYGRPLDYFVRTETLRAFSEKTLQDIMVDIVVDIDG